MSEFLAQLGPVKPTHPLPIRATYHDACHLCHAQQIRKPPRQLLEMIPGLELVPLAESEICCGAAGSYNLTQPEMAERLGDRKMANILATGANPDAVFVASDLMARGVLTVLAGAGLRVPEDIAIMGFDDSPVATSVTPQLTTVRQPSFAQGERMASVLLDLLAGRHPRHVTILETELVVRDSV